MPINPLYNSLNLVGVDFVPSPRDISVSKENSGVPVKVKTGSLLHTIDIVRRIYTITLYNVTEDFLQLLKQKNKTDSLNLLRGITGDITGYLEGRQIIDGVLTNIVPSEGYIYQDGVTYYDTVTISIKSMALEYD